MKNKDLIAKLQQMDPEQEVCIFDHLHNLDEDSGDGTAEGVYPNFEVEPIGFDDLPAKTQPWIALTFNEERKRK